MSCLEFVMLISYFWKCILALLWDSKAIVRSIDPASCLRTFLECDCNYMGIDTAGSLSSPQLVSS